MILPSIAFMEGHMIDSIEDAPAQGSFTLTAGIVFALKQEAARRSISISELVREILSEALTQKTGDA